MGKSPCLLTFVLLVANLSAPAQVKTVPQYIDEVRALASRSDVKAANDYIDRNHESILREWVAITEINAPSGYEQERAKYIETLFTNIISTIFTTTQSAI